MIDIQNFSITKTIFESDSFSIYQVNEKNNPNLLISKVIKQPITDEEMIFKQIEFFFNNTSSLIFTISWIFINRFSQESLPNHYM